MLLNVALNQIITVIIIFVMILTTSYSNNNADQSASTMEKGGNDSNFESVKEVIVIGGGLAGMAVARKLTNHQQFEVKVFEACADRYGGRIWTDRRSAENVRGIDGEMGAMWLNSKIKDNQLLKLVREMEITVKSPGPVQLHVPHQNRVIKGEDLKKILTDFMSIILKAVEKARLSPKDSPLSEALKTELETSDIQTDKSIFQALIGSHYATSVKDYSSQTFRPDRHFGWDFAVVDGFDQIVDGLVGGLEAEIPVAVELDTVVRHVEVDKKRGKVVVRTTDLKQHLADAVIVAVPLGVLKNNSVLFEPALPEEWQKTVQKLGVSYTNKLILEFDEVFWPKDVGVFTLIPSSPSEYGMFQSWVNIHHFNGRPVLMGTAGGIGAKDIEQMGDEELKSKALSILSKLFGEETVKSRNITRMQRSRWQSDPNTQGGNTYPMQGIERENLHYLSDPVCPHIYFAGEYTDVEDAHTALGAYKSGIRAANQLIDKFCEKSRKKREEKQVKEEQKKSEELGTSKDEL